MKYKVNDRVRIKSLDWYNRYTNGTEVNCKHYPFTCDMKNYCGQIMTINIVRGHSYYMIEDDGTYAWTDEMIEGLVEEETKPNIIEEAKTYWDSIKDAWICPEGYQFVDENGNVINATKIVLEKKKKE